MLSLHLRNFDDNFEILFSKVKVYVLGLYEIKILIFTVPCEFKLVLSSYPFFYWLLEFLLFVSFQWQGT